MAVSLGGLLLGWLVYRNVSAEAPDPLQEPLGPLYPVLKNKYYFDELYDRLFVRPAYWFAETFAYRWVDRGLIDGILHGVARFSLQVGSFLRNAIDLPIVNGAGDLVGSAVKRFGNSVRVIQTGRVQEYMLVGLFFTGLLVTYLLLFRP